MMETSGITGAYFQLRLGKQVVTTPIHKKKKIGDLDFENALKLHVLVVNLVFAPRFTMISMQKQPFTRIEERSLVFR